MFPHRIRTTPHHTGIGSDEWFLFCGSGSLWGIVLGIVVPVGNGWALFLSGGELSFPHTFEQDNWQVKFMLLLVDKIRLCGNKNLDVIYFFIYNLFAMLPRKWRKWSTSLRAGQGCFLRGGKMLQCGGGGGVLGWCTLFPSQSCHNYHIE